MRRLPSCACSLGVVSPSDGPMDPRLSVVAADIVSTIAWGLKHVSRLAQPCCTQARSLEIVGLALIVSRCNVEGPVWPEFCWV